MNRSPSERRFDDRVVVVTGGARGLGRAYAELVASLGAKVVVNDNGSALSGSGGDAGPAGEVAGVLRDMGAEAVASTDSVATPEGGKAIIEAALDVFGRIDVLIHNAGNNRFANLAETSYEDFRAVLDVHLLGAFHVVRPAFERMVKDGYGRVVLTGSIGGLYSMPGVVNYAMSKSGMIGLNNIVAIEGREFGVKSNMILPGAVTRMAEGLDISQYPPMGPDLVAPVVGWLAHESCSVSGEMYVSMAGRIARAFITETRGVYRPEWTMDTVADQIDAIRDDSDCWTFHPVENGFGEHMARSFEMARQG
ncbi:SDR family NAD(P)-dependent oxidoreductase [Novosphingobium mangrovi (ex Huang et al. 2023)]|uniref:SDR family NAD(P)-dependent oxidoreductase n=1 Tax=Novosphingobium mangrovi (ex Huang et al. 2023) TaxID=2976432 RepID=A0ABT2I508_9SPHN|nr:SDR family NAD(P)-dependent oxidoreductase [Novosphingobium mangrovi (ex Huang et al. 2023)]MCT2399915.1 SDR family NAD(P)-dependent oxidoreductase [Novosphingobium mangrovi (ex Huang et al. 2023)]